MVGTDGLSDDRALADLAITVESSRRARAAARRRCADADVARRRLLDTQARALDAATTAVDGSARPGATMTTRLERLSGQAGRSPLIEQAKARLVDQYGISRGEAFELLKVLSTNSNRKLRDVAAHLVNT